MKSKKKSYPPHRVWFKILSFLVLLLFGWQEFKEGKTILPNRGGSAKVYSTHTQHDLRTLLLEGIARAEDSILLIIYALHDEKIVAALKKKARDGCSVHVVADPKASLGITKKLGNLINCKTPKVKGLMHHKLLVIDHKFVITSSANCTAESLRFHGNLSLAMDSPTFASAIWKQAKAICDPSLPRPTLAIDQIGNQKIEMHFLPSQKAKQRLEQVLSNAQKTTQVAMYTLTHQELCDSLIRSKADVKVVVDRGTSKGASRQAIQQLCDQAIRVAISDTSPLLHYKMALIDDVTLVAGSANWTRGAFQKNYDNLVIVHDLNSEQQSIIHHAWKAIWKESCDF